ncbi:MAG TPA: hypothetical protein VGJ30_12065, partial [Candidatus Angelobacter sp.]
MAKSLKMFLFKNVPESKGPSPLAMGLFPKFKCELGSSFSSQRHGGHLATTHTHVLANNCHEKKVYVRNLR